MHIKRPTPVSLLVVILSIIVGLQSVPISAQHKQTVLADIFTNSHCSPCATMHAAVESSIKGKSVEDDVIIIYHHLRVYADDPIYQDNTVEPGQRATFLGGVSGTPTVFFNASKWTTSFSGWPTYLSAEVQTQTDYDITGTLTTTSDSAHIVCTVTRGKENVADVNLYSVLVENVNYLGRNGVSDHNGAMRVGFTNATGVPMSFDANGVSNVRLSAPIKSNWDRTKLRAVFVAQDPATKKPIQAYQVLSDQPTSVQENVGESAFTSGPARIELYSSTGELLGTSSILSHNSSAVESVASNLASHMPTALYYIRVTQGNAFYVRPRVILH